MKLIDFENDLINFIKNHKYIKEQESDVVVNLENESDSILIEIDTINGDYESIEILINYIS